jgi:hypothetical protein
VKWPSAEINGPCYCTQNRSTTQKNLGMGSSEANFFSGLVRTDLHYYYSLCCVQAYKHIFTSPSSVEKEVKATRSGNARIHGMTRVTTASLAYVATQVRLAWKLHQLNSEHSARSALPCHRHQCSVGLTPRRTRNDSTRVSWTS